MVTVDSYICSYWYTTCLQCLIVHRIPCLNRSINYQLLLMYSKQIYIFSIHACMATYVHTSTAVRSASLSISLVVFSLLTLFITLRDLEIKVIRMLCITNLNE